jgi:hypothetical protein
VASDKLGTLIRDEAASGHYRYMTLLDLAVSDSDPTSSRERFPPRALDRATRQARQAGWQVQRSPLPREPTQRARTLRILPGLTAKTLDL